MSGLLKKGWDESAWVECWLTEPGIDSFFWGVAHENGGEAVV